MLSSAMRLDDHSGYGVKRTALVAGYKYENYTLEDWQQGSLAPWVEPGKGRRQMAERRGRLTSTVLSQSLY